MTELKTLLVTGDIVLDCHLYGGVKTLATSFKEPGTVYTQRLGGAALTCELVRAAAEAAGATIDNNWKKETKKCKRDHKALPARPEGLPLKRPLRMYNVELDLATIGLKRTLPKHLRSYGVWIDRPAKKGSKDRVWRIERHFGYGPTDPKIQGEVFKRNAMPAPVQPMLTLIDDGGILFRHSASSGAWPEFKKGETGYYLIKMSSPLCRGDLWEKMTPITDRMIVVFSAMDLRREDAQVNLHLSWEQCVEHTITALQNHPIVRDLLRVAHVIVNFGSAGALWVERTPDGASAYHLLFDPELLEGDISRRFDGTAYGFQTCLTAGIAHHLMQFEAEAVQSKTKSPFTDAETRKKAISQGIAAGLVARRRLRELGHGRIDKPQPSFPIQELGQSIANPTEGFVYVDVPPIAWQAGPCQWTILNQSETVQADQADYPLSGLAYLTARYGFGALSHIPKFHLGKLYTVDRSEIESYRMLAGLIRAYEEVKVQKKPLSIGVFGPPGAGKSFGVKALAEGILGEQVPFLEFNLSQFKSPEELIGAFHRVRDAVLGGITPVAFWDEFDSQNYRWLQYLLAPMQDGSFQEGQITHPIGKCIFIFAGGTSHTMDDFCAKLQRREFQMLKGPDFISRLHGFLNVLGPNRRKHSSCPDITWPIRRAIILRDVSKVGEDEELDIDPGLLDALLNVSDYRHGARSFDKVVATLLQGRHFNHLHRSALPPSPLLDRETDAVKFIAMLKRWDVFKNHPDLENLAAAIHTGFLEGAEKSKQDAEIEANPNLAWTIHQSIKRDYAELSDDKKASNRAAARRIPDHLALIGYAVEPWQQNDKQDWQTPLKKAIEKHTERLAQAEHLGWYAERVANGWTHAEKRNDTLKHHPLMVPWAKLLPSDQEKDRHFVRSIPALLEMAKYKAVPIPTIP